MKTFGGLLEQNLRSLEIECLPRDLPDVITVDVSHLNIGDAIHVRELPLPQGVTTRVPADLTVVLGPRADSGRRAGGRCCGSSLPAGSDHGEEGSARSWRGSAAAAKGAPAKEKEAKK